MISIIKDEDEFTIWTDEDENPQSGRCLAVSRDKKIALQEAKMELLRDLGEVANKLEEVEK